MRRRIVRALAGAACVPSCLVAQPRRRPFRIALLGVATPAGYAKQIEALRRGLRERGYTEGTDLVIDERWTGGDFARLPELVAELLRTNPDVLVTSGPGSAAARRATTSVPIVMAVAADAVANGLVASFARPGGNVTGSSFSLAELNVKRLQVLKQGVPGLRRVAVLLLRGSSLNASVIQAMGPTAVSAGVELLRVEAADASGIEGAFRTVREQRADGLVVSDHPMIVVEAARVAALARSQRLSAIGFAEYAHAGGLLGYGVDFTLMWHRAAHFVDRILKGAKPGDLPVEQPARYELVVNLAAARVVGIVIPESLRVRADTVLE
jgi:putative ABC transport system substrate-binding protein